MKNILEQELIDIIRLKNSENVSNLTFFKLIEYYGNVSKALENIPDLAKKNTKKPFKIYPLNKALQDIEECKKQNIQIISYNDLRYPVLLNQIEDKPPILYAKGNTSILSKTAITIVGTRSPSLNGLKLAHKFAKELSDLDMLTVSGMALGIDTAVHKASLKNGTVAFLGNGVNIIYPKENKELYYKILEYGAVISEYPIGSKPLRYNFPKRNRLLSGMSHATIVIEASIKSGSLITAKCAVEQNREVFAVPSNPNDINSQGTNQLIKEGAYLLENINDILEFIAKWKGDAKCLMEDRKSLQPNLFVKVDEESVDKLKNKILPLLSYTPVSIDLLTREPNLNIKIISKAILELELSGIIVRYPGNKISLKLEF